MLPLVLVGAAACQGDSPTPTSLPSESSTPLASYETAGLSVAREAFCARIAPVEVVEALGGEVASSTSYNNGEPAQVTSRVKDVAHEFDCTWTAADGTTARAWVFAPPVTRARARDLEKQARAMADCRPDEGAPDFGTHSVALLCGASRFTTASYRGLFGDAWLTCSLRTRAQGTDQGELLDRAGRWCVTVVEAARVR